MDKWIKLSLPHLGTNEIEYVKNAFVDSWVVPLGPDVDEFENRLERYLGHDHVVALSAGTAAIHLGLLMLGVGPGDEVICQSLTFAASANPIRYLGADPVFVDSEPLTWSMSPEMLRTAIDDRIKKTGRKPKAIIPVDLYGMPAQLDALQKVADEYGIPMLEDSAEALGSEYKGRKCGSFGEYACLSFNGNKIITTSGGGALVCPTEDAAKRVMFYATQARENKPYYYHNHIGYNYRLSNISAAIGCGQMDVLEDHLARRREIHRIYSDALSEIKGLTVQSNPDSRFDSNFWLTNILLDPKIIHHSPDELRVRLLDRRIETRLIWRPMHLQPIYSDAPYYGSGVSNTIFQRGLCLPSGSSLSDDEIAVVIDSIREILS